MLLWFSINTLQWFRWLLWWFFLLTFFCFVFNTQGTCCLSDETCCGAPDVSFGGICCVVGESYCCPAVCFFVNQFILLFEIHLLLISFQVVGDNGHHYPYRCCGDDKVCCNSGTVGCCTPAELEEEMKKKNK